jgi:hypothetical protein
MIDSMTWSKQRYTVILDLEVALPQLLEQGVKLRQIVYVNILSWCSTNSAKLSSIPVQKTDRVVHHRRSRFGLSSGGFIMLAD